MRDPIEDMKARLDEAEREHGELPESIIIADYTRESFADLRPNDSWDVWRAETKSIITYLCERGIKVRRRMVTAKTQHARAAQAGHGPYRLGVSIGSYGTKDSYGVIGFATVFGLDEEDNPAYPDGRSPPKRKTRRD
jgi:hypothetical protein